MAIPYVQLEYREGVAAKKEILGAEMSLLRLVKSLVSYKAMRKLELQKKVALKTSIKALSAKMDSLVSDLPEVENLPKIKQELKISASPEFRKKKTIDAELEQIKEQLDRLS